MAYELQRWQSGVYKKFTGVLTINDYMVASTEVSQLPDYAELKFSINDFTHIDGFQASIRDWAYCAALDMGMKSRNAAIQLAIISTDAKLLTLVRTLYQTATQYQIDYFSTLEEADAMLSRKLGFPIFQEPMLA